MQYRFANAFTLLACGLVAGTAGADPGHVYLEEEGAVLFEVEDAESVDGWLLKTDLADYAGSGYLEWSWPNSTDHSTAGEGNITYHFRIQTAGNYELRWRSHIAKGESSTDRNDSWVRFATGEDVPEQESLDGWTKVYMNTLGAWTWDTRTVDYFKKPVRQFFAQGDHTLEISGRSKYHAIDRIALYRYEDMDFNNSAVNDWGLSNVVLSDGTVVDPNETTPPENPDPESTDPEDPPPVVLQNLSVADPAWEERANNECSDNTLALPALITRSVDPADADSDYTAAEYLTLSAGVSSVLMKFDLSLVPPADYAVIDYSSGSQSSNGNIRYSLGSPGDWSEDSSSDVQQPHFMLELRQASGGWGAQTRYQSTLPADLLGNDNNTTIIISSDAESDPLDIFAYSSSSLAPRLLLSGNASFCRDWQSNVDAFNAPVEPPAETEAEETAGPEVIEEAEITTADPDPESASRKVGVGGSLSWLVLLVLSAASAGKACYGLRRVHASSSRHVRLADYRR